MEEAYRSVAEAGHPIPPELLEPVEGITLHYLALLDAALAEPGVDATSI